MNSDFQTEVRVSVRFEVLEAIVAPRCWLWWHWTPTFGNRTIVGVHREFESWSLMLQALINLNMRIHMYFSLFSSTLHLNNSIAFVAVALHQGSNSHSETTNQQPLLAREPIHALIRLRRFRKVETLFLNTNYRRTCGLHA